MRITYIGASDLSESSYCFRLCSRTSLSFIVLIWYIQFTTFAEKRAFRPISIASKARFHVFVTSSALKSNTYPRVSSPTLPSQYNNMSSTPMTPGSVDGAKSPLSSPPSSPPSAQGEDAEYTPKVDQVRESKANAASEPNRASLEGLERYLEGSQVC